MLTDVQSTQINNTEVYTLDYEAEALQSYEDTGNDLMDELEVRATNVILEQTDERSCWSNCRHWVLWKENSIGCKDVQNS